MRSRILLAEDDENLQIIVRDYLQAYGFDVVVTGNGEEALQDLSRQTPDLLILDVAMPVLDGLEVAKRIRQIPKYADLPIMALTARVLPEDEARVYAAGCNAFVTKPFTPDRMLSEVRRLLRLPDELKT